MSISGDFRSELPSVMSISGDFRSELTLAMSISGDFRSELTSAKRVSGITASYRLRHVRLLRSNETAYGGEDVTSSRSGTWVRRVRWVRCGLRRVSGQGK